MIQHSPRRATLAAALAVALGAAAQSADAAIVYSNAFADAGPNPGGAARLLDDVNLPPGTAPETIRSAEVGYRNYGAAPVDVDLVLTFWDDMNTAATSTQAVNSAKLNSYTIPLGVVAGNAAGTFTFNLPSVQAVTDNTLGVEIAYVLAGTTTLAPVAARVVLESPTVGTSAAAFWSDDNPPDGTFRGSNVGAGEEVSGGNLYLILNTSIVPEPTAIATIGAAAALTLARRRKR